MTLIAGYDSDISESNAWINRKFKNLNYLTNKVSQGVNKETKPLMSNEICSGTFPPHRWQTRAMGNIIIQYPRKNDDSTVSWIGLGQL